MTKARTRAKVRRLAAETLLDPAVIRELSAAVPGFDRAGLLSALMDCWGGMDRLALDIYTEYNAAPKGSMIRQRILQMILASISQHSNDENVVPVGDLDDVQLRRQILRVLPDLTRMEAQDGDPDAA